MIKVTLEAENKLFFMNYKVYMVTFVRSNVTQRLKLIPQIEYDAAVQASELGEVSDMQKEILAMKKNGSMFTSQSPIGLALKNGNGILVLPKSQGGESEIKFVKL